MNNNKRFKRSVSFNRQESVKSTGRIQDSESNVEYKAKPKRSDALRGRPNLRKLVQYVSRNITPHEKKYRFVTGNTTLQAVAASGAPNVAPYLLTGMSRGTTVSTRNADLISLLRGKLQGTFLGNNGPCTFRIMVILDKKPNGTALTNSVLFQTSTPTATTFIDFNNQNNMERYTVMASRTYTIPSATLTTTTNYVTTQHVDLSWDANHYVASYKLGNAGTIADIDDGAVYVCIQQGPTYGGTGSGFIFYMDAVQYFSDA